MAIWDMWERMCQLQPEHLIITFFDRELEKSPTTESLLVIAITLILLV
jgi:hypothetical protein